MPRQNRPIRREVSIRQFREMSYGEVHDTLGCLLTSMVFGLIIFLLATRCWGD